MAYRALSSQNFYFPSFPRQRESRNIEISVNSLKRLDTRIPRVREDGYDEFKDLAKTLAQ